MPAKERYLKLFILDDKANADKTLGLPAYAGKNCDNPVSMYDDFTPGIYEFPTLLLNSFELVNRGLEDQEQLDISKKDQSGNLCGDFVMGFYKGFGTSCNNWDDITCFTLWLNRGL